ncbi:MAG TPA: hypothetical protein VMZ53_16155 [Kofleriaceae bacterium]|nr:hypothetical protein [Kofleriaceae bacterium]
MRNLTCAPMTYLLLLVASTAACGGDDEIDSDEQARRAYLCLDGSIQKSIDLGFAGFSAASSANIPEQTGAGDVAGTIKVNGQVDQGSSNNKGMRLNVGMVGYDDGPVEYNPDHDKVHVVFDTATTVADQPYLSLQLKNIPSGTLDGTLTSNSSMHGIYTLSGDIQGTLTLNLTIAGPIMAGSGNVITVRVPGMTTVTGTATNSDGGVYNISITI